MSTTQSKRQNHPVFSRSLSCMNKTREQLFKAYFFRWNYEKCTRLGTFDLDLTVPPFSFPSLLPTRCLHVCLTSSRWVAARRSTNSIQKIHTILCCSVEEQSIINTVSTNFDNLREESEEAPHVGRTCHKEEGIRRGSAWMEPEEEPYLGRELATGVAQRGRPLPPVLFLLLLPNPLGTTPSPPPAPRRQRPAA
jgi:hypothetical protein